MGSGRVLKTLDRSLHILTLFDAEHRSWGVTELARHMDLPKSVVQKTLATFARRGFLYQEPGSRRYRLGPRILSLARLAEPELAHMARPHMIRLTEATQETAKLTVVDGPETVIIAAVESPRSLRMAGRVGERNRLHAGATNKLLAAHLPWSDVEAAAAMPGRSNETASKGRGKAERSDLRTLRRQLQGIYEAGHAMSHGEIEPGVASIAVPVYGDGGRVIACLSVVGPKQRMLKSAPTRFLPTLHEASAAISISIGYETDDLDGETAGERGDALPSVMH